MINTIALGLLIAVAPPLFFSKPDSPPPPAAPAAPVPAPPSTSATSSGQATPPQPTPAPPTPNQRRSETAKPKPIRRAICKTHRGESVCGFGCLTKYNQRRCANTPAGVCHAARGEVTCWDPPHGVGDIPGVEKACCFERVGEVHCGYNCVESGRDMKCSQFPTGVCQDHRGEVKCWDPAPLYAAGTKQAECVAHQGELVCGFGCQKRAGDAQCAQTPNGICRVERGAIVCWDPPAS